MLGAHADAGQRLPRVRVRGQGLARARAVLRAQGRGGHGGRDPLRAGEAQPQDGHRVPRLVRRPVRDEGRRALDRGVRRRPRALRAARAAVRGRRARPPARRPPQTPDGEHAATVAQPTKVDNELYVRDYSKCILCYKCVEGCGTDWQNTFAIAVAGRGFDARIATEFANPLPDSACVYCGNCIARLPDRRAHVQERVRPARGRDVARGASRPSPTTICTYCGVGCNLELHEQDNEIVKVTSPLDHPVTHGNLCIKGRFGFQFVQNDRGGLPPPAELDLLELVESDGDGSNGHGAGD